MNTCDTFTPKTVTAQKFRIGCELAMKFGGGSSAEADEAVSVREVTDDFDLVESC